MRSLTTCRSVYHSLMNPCTRWHDQRVPHPRDLCPGRNLGRRRRHDLRPKPRPRHLLAFGHCRSARVHPMTTIWRVTLNVSAVVDVRWGARIVVAASDVDTQVRSTRGAVRALTIVYHVNMRVSRCLRHHHHRSRILYGCRSSRMMAAKLTTRTLRTRDPDHGLRLTHCSHLRMTTWSRLWVRHGRHPYNGNWRC